MCTTDTWGRRRGSDEPREYFSRANKKWLTVASKILFLNWPPWIFQIQLCSLYDSHCQKGPQWSFKFHYRNKLEKNRIYVINVLVITYIRGYWQCLLKKKYNIQEVNTWGDFIMDLSFLNRVYFLVIQKKITCQISV